MKRIIMTVVAVLAIVLGIAGPAAASYTTTPRTFTYADVATEVQFNFRTQDDGTGVRVEYFWLFTNRGCDSLENDGNGAYDPVKVEMWNSAGTAVLNTVNFGPDGCQNYHDMELPGPDTGCVQIHVTLKARINNMHDRWLYVGYKFCPNPERSDFLYMEQVEA
jgi:hypothetical protein